MKDRIALRMIQQAEEDGLISPGKTTLVSCQCMSSWNLGYLKGS